MAGLLEKPPFARLLDFFQILPWRWQAKVKEQLYMPILQLSDEAGRRENRLDQLESREQWKEFAPIYEGESDSEFRNRGLKGPSSQ